MSHDFFKKMKNKKKKKKKSLEIKKYYDFC